MIAPASGHRALLVDGTPVLVRRIGAADRAEVDRLHRELPLEDLYLRFFTVSRAGSDQIAASIVAPDSIAVGAWRDGRLLGVAHCRSGPGDADPELAVAVAHREQAHGIASLLLEHLVSAAREAGVRRLTAEVLTANHDMLRVLADAGLPLTRRTDADVVHVTLELPALDGLDPAGERYLDAVLSREAGADVASLRAVLEPRSIAVIGAGRRPESVGRAVLRRIVESGFSGPVHVVHPHAAAVAGIPTHRSVADLPRGVDLAVVCVPAAVVGAVAQECGAHGVRALLVISSGVDAGELAAVAARYGMRVVGPNCVGLVNTDPGVRLQASFGPQVAGGCVGLALQSGGVAIALAAELGRLGLGVSSLVSTGEALDVNGDDLMLWWPQDGRTRAAVLYVESLRRPRMFARLARRLARRMPVLTVRSGSSAPGARAAASHSAGTVTPGVVRDALLAQAGVLAVDELSRLPGLLAVLTSQPLPAGRRTVVLSNAGGAGVLAADACARAGLTVEELGPATRAALAAVLPPGAVTANPVDTTATVPPAAFGRALDVLLAADDVDAVLALGVTTAVADPLAALGAAQRRPGKPVVAVRLGQSTTVRWSSDRGSDHAQVPVFADASAAAAALSTAADRASWLRRSTVPATVPAGVDARSARRIVAEALSARPAGGWLPPVPAAGLLAAAGIAVVATRVVTEADDAVRCHRDLGCPVALKADVPGLVHKSRAGAVRTGLRTAGQVERAFGELRERFGAALRGVVVQPMAAPGTELLLATTGDPVCGPLLTLGLGGTGTDLVDDRAHCLAPATEADVDDLLDGLRAASRLYRGPDGARLREAARDAVRRMSWLAAVLPELAEAEVNPLVVGDVDGGAVAVDVRVRLQPAPVDDDPYLRRLPT